jgi:hypothetical protein
MRLGRAAVNTQGGTVSNFSVRFRAIVLSGPLIDYPRLRRTRRDTNYGVLTARPAVVTKNASPVELPAVSYLPSNGT